MRELKTIRRLWPLLRAYRWVVPATVVLGTLASLSEGVGITLFLPLLQSLDGHSEERLPAIAGLIIALTLSKSLLTYAHSALAAEFNSRLTKQIRSKVYSKILDIPQARLNQLGSGRLINLLATDTWHTSDAISLFIAIVINLCSIVVFSLFLIALSWKLTLLVLAAVVLVSQLLRRLTAAASRLGQEGVAANTALSEQMLDALEGLREIQMLGLQSLRRQHFEAASESVRSIFRRLDLLHRAVPPLTELLYVVLLLGLLLVGVAGKSTASTMIVFVLILYRFQPQIRQLDANRLSLAALARSVEDIADFCRDESPRAPGAGSGEPAPSGDIEFDGVIFRYGNDQDLALRGVSFRAPHGQTTAIIGPSGSGKTTIVSLLCGFYEPVGGEIRVGGVPLAEMDIEAWRGRIAWVCQGAHIFSGTIRDNISYGRMGAGEEEIVEAAIRADAHSFISDLADGYDTKVGNGGMELSSGQMQRIALARAFLRRADFLILDEATNALDSLSEDVIQEFLRHRPAGQTVIIISHRLSTLKFADKAVVLEAGRIADVGAPRQLALRGGLYSRLRELQHVE